MNIEYLENALENNIDIIKTITLVILVYYSNFKITNNKIRINFNQICKFILIIISAVIYEIIKLRTNYFISTISLILMISIVFSTDKIGTSIIVTTSSLAINYAILILTITLDFIINTIVGINNNCINLIIITIGHIIIVKSFWKIRKFKKGILLFNRNINDEHIDLIMLNIVLITILVITLLSNSNINFLRNIALTLIISLMLMFITIQKSLQLYYKRKLLEQELTHTREELEKKCKEIEILETENINISKKSHTLIHKQKILEYKIKEIASKTEISQEEAGEVRAKLKEIEKNIYKEKTAIDLDKTGIKEIDETLEYMQSECIKSKIDFELQLKGNIYYMTNNIISKEELGTLLADHIKNAIIAIKHTNNVNRSILVRLGQIDENYGLYIYDSGIEFENSTLKNLGKKPSTTHAEEGGTGMGFMNTFDTLKKCKASLIIEEYNKPNKDNYTKAIFIKFDNKNEFKIKSYRSNI